MSPQEAVKEIRKAVWPHDTPIPAQIGKKIREAVMSVHETAWEIGYADGRKAEKEMT